MTKFTIEEKLDAIQRFLDGHGGYSTIAKSFKTVASTIKKWVLQYEYNGVEGLLKSYTNYTSEYKLDVLNYMSENRTSLYETAAIFNIPSPYTISKWKKILEEEGVDALHSKNRGRPSMKKEQKKTPPREGSLEALKAENEKLRMENMYLKKLQALIQDKSKLKNKTKRK